MRIFRTLTFTLAILMNLASHAQDSRSVNLSAENGRIAPRAVMSVRNRSGKIIRHGESAWPTSLVCCATAMLSDE